MTVQAAAQEPAPQVAAPAADLVVTTVTVARSKGAQPGHDYDCAVGAGLERGVG
jgi:hypothetical protein